MRIYLFLWLVITTFLSFEYWALSSQPHLSILLSLQANGVFDSTIKFSIVPGRTLSLWLGWIGFGLMVVMNVYSLRKRFEFMKSLGRLSSWLNFHIFCGLLGPTLIFFHCGLKVRGLVGISFWSMIVSFTSGIIGRYFFVQLSTQKSEFEKIAQLASEKLSKNLEKFKIQLEPETKSKILKLSLAHAGGSLNQESPSPLGALFSTLEGDLRMALSNFPVPKNWPLKAKLLVQQYAVNSRKAQTLASFEKLMGYWHAFHFPFAIFMYLAAVIHIVSSLIFLGG